jgi:formylglycine-generating enzyme required for sulfatase activity
LELSAGEHHLSIRAQRYVAYEGAIEVEGAGVEQSIEIELTPAWSTVHVTSFPGGALIRVEGDEVGQTPLTLELAAGELVLEAELAGYKTWRGDINVEANRELTLPPIQLEPVDGHLLLRSRPAAAHVSVGGTLAGQTPVELLLEPGEAHEITLFKPGYELATRRVQVKPGERVERTVKLAPRHGIVELSLIPSDAVVRLDGRETVERRLRLLAIPHEIQVSKGGYASRAVTVTPRPEFPQRIAIVLLTEAEARKAARSEIVSKRGERLVLVEPGSFVMGAARGTPGRRPNEAPRAVALTRPFYLGVKEITNRDFREFRPGHHAPPFHGEDLDAEEQPVSSVSWDDAARFCNWLSGQEGLPPAYVDRGDRMVPVQPIPASYRLPTEAEWAWVARFAAGGGGLLYPWGNELPPPPGSGNYADVEGARVLDRAMSSYNDGFSVAAPVGSSTANGLRIFDMGGNVAEWIHDYYGIASRHSPGAPQKDPAGPPGGAHHVIRGSSWKHWNITQLRFSYRDYGNEGRVDVGFRIARNVD